MSRQELQVLIDRAEESFSSNDFKKFWILVKQINSGLATIGLEQQERSQILKWLNDRCEAAKARMSSQGEERKNSSLGKKRLIETTIRQAMAATLNASTAQELSLAKDLLNTASERMKDGYNHGFDATYSLTIHDGVLTREDREWCSAFWREARNGVENRRKEIHDSNYHHLSGLAARAFNKASAGNGSEAKEIVREAQAEMKGAAMSADQFQIVRNNLNKAWELADRSQREKFESGAHDFIYRAEELIAKNEGVIDSINGQINHCEDLLASARGHDFSSRVQGWISEKKSKIRDIEQTNNELREKVRDAKNRLHN